MNINFTEAIRQIQEERGISEDLVLKTVQEFLLAAYKRHFGTDENAVVQFADDRDGVSLFARKTIVPDDDFEDPVLEITLNDALEFDAGSEIGDELLIELDLQSFDRGSVMTAKQRAKQDFRDIQKDTIYSEYKDKIGELVIGYYQRERNGSIFVDLGKAEGVLPKKFRSQREDYRPGERIKAMIVEVKRTQTGLQILLSRTHPELVRKIFEIEVPEIYDGTVEIHKIVREAGYRTKVAVMTAKEDVDPVGACVGVKGMRIQTVVRELEGEKIDILRFDPDPGVFIKNALLPAQVQNVYIRDSSKKMALAVVEDSQLSLAIGKDGLNVRLANRLTDWNIDVKTLAQFAELELAGEGGRAASELFREEEEGGDEEISRIKELPGIPARLIEVLFANGIEMIEDLVNISREDLQKMEGFTADDIVDLDRIIEENIEVVVETEEESAEADDEEVDITYECPDCGTPVTLDMSNCPGCGVGLSFESEDEDSQE